MAKCFWVVLFILCCKFTFAQFNCFEYEAAQFDKSSYEATKLAYFEAILNESDPHKKACLSYYHGRNCYKNGESNLALSIWQDGFTEYLKDADFDSVLVHKLTFNSAVVNYHAKNYTKAIELYKQAKNFSNNKTDQSKCDVNISICYRENGAYTLSNYYSRNAINSLKENDLTASKWLSEAYAQLAVNYNEILLPDSAIQFANLFIESSKNLNEHTLAYNKMYGFTILGNAYETKQDYSNYIDYSDKTLKLAKVRENDNYIFKSLNNLGYAHNKLGNQQKALSYLIQASQFAQKIGDQQKYADAINTIGDVFYQNDNYPKASQYYLEALQLLLDDKSIRFNQPPSIKKVEQLDFINDVFVYAKILSESLVKQAKAFNKAKVMDDALKYIHFADELLLLVNDNTLDNKSKFYWRSQAAELYKLGIEAANFLNNENQIFYFIERGKYFVLQDLLQENAQLSQLPQQLQTDLQTINQTISALEIKQATIPLKTDELKQLIDAKESLHSIKDSIQRIELNNELDIKQLDLAAIQSEYLKDSTSLYLTYLEYPDVTYAIALSKNNSTFYEISSDSNYLQTKERFINTVSQPINTATIQQQFLEDGHLLYKRLLPPNINNFKNLIINPSGTLNFVPFETLCSAAQSQRFTIEDFLVRYTISPSFEKQTEKQSKSSALFVAPIDFTNLELNELKESELEAKRLQKLIGGRILAKDQATKTKFQAELNQHSTLHFATHSLANNQNSDLPWIAFYDDKMYLPEIYNLSLKDKFVVLSACETFRGDLLQGEGIMNLVWGIYYAGSNSVVATLWNTYDKANQKIMQRFYAELKQGHSKATALRNAKLAYMQQNKMQVNQWAPFIYIGIDNDVQFKKSKQPIYFLSIGLCLLLLSLLYFRNKK